MTQSNWCNTLRVFVTILEICLTFLFFFLTSVYAVTHSFQTSIALIYLVLIFQSLVIIHQSGDVFGISPLQGGVDLIRYYRVFLCNEYTSLSVTHFCVLNAQQKSFNFAVVMKVLKRNPRNQTRKSGKIEAKQTGPFK